MTEVNLDPVVVVVAILMIALAVLLVRWIWRQ
jgi:hypothetical protein